MQTPSYNMAVTSYLSGDASSAKDIGWADLSGYNGLLVTATAAALTGLGVTAFKILANSQSDGGGTDVTVKTHALGTAPDAAGDMVVLECTADEVAAAAAAAGETGVRYVSAQLTCDNAADNIVVQYIRTAPRYAAAGLTADVISS